MADQTDISQAISELGADRSSTQVSQAVSELGADASSAQISQAVSEIGVGASSAQISQLLIEIGAAASTAIISQLTIELGRGPEVIPPADSPSSTFAFDEEFGLGVSWYIVPQLTDSGVETRDKRISSVSVRGKVTNASFGVFGYGALDDIDVAAIEAGNINSLTGVRILPNTTMVQQSRRFPVNVKNITNHTTRVQGTWDGTGERDRIDEIVYEVSVLGARR